VLFWHLGATTALIRYAFRDERMDLRFLALGAILPDMLDTPVGFAAWSRFHAVRLAGHSLLFAAVIMVAVLLGTRRGRPRRRWMALAVGVLTHLLLDAMWRSPQTLWWPFLGGSFTTTDFATIDGYLRWLLTDPWMWAGEVAGLLYLAVLARRARLAQRERLVDFLHTGRLDVPIGG